MFFALPPGADPGPSQTDWIQALSSAAGAVLTLLAVVVAVIALLVERSRRRQDVERLENQRAEDLEMLSTQRSEDLARIEADRADRDAAQARLVMTTLDFTPGGRVDAITVINHSSQAIFDVETWLALRDGSDIPGKARWSFIVPALSATFGEKNIAPPDTYAVPADENHPYAAWVEFLDARGLRWRRCHLMEPVRHQRPTAGSATQQAVPEEHPQ